LRAMHRSRFPDILQQSLFPEYVGNTLSAVGACCPCRHRARSRAGAATRRSIRRSRWMGNFREPAGDWRRHEDRFSCLPSRSCLGCRCRHYMGIGNLWLGRHAASSS
jgi:hypothetical protein